MWEGSTIRYGIFIHRLVLGGACSSTDGTAINSDACTCGEDVCAINQFCDASQASGSKCMSQAELVRDRVYVDCGADAAPRDPTAPNGPAFRNPLLHDVRTHLVESECMHLSNHFHGAAFQYGKCTGNCHVFVDVGSCRSVETVSSDAVDKNLADGVLYICASPPCQIPSPRGARLSIRVAVVFVPSAFRLPLSATSSCTEMHIARRALFRCLVFVRFQRK